MKNAITLLAICLVVGQVAQAQDKYFTRDGKVSFFSATPVEDIEAHNDKMTCVLDASTGNVEFAVLIKSFEFEKALMEEHFNENYMESNDFPKATFKGTIEEFPNLVKAGFPPSVEMIAKGTMTIHGVSKEIQAVGHIMKEGEGLHLTSKFVVNPEDYNIEIPNTVRDNIAKEIKVDVDAELKPLKK